MTRLLYRVFIPRGGSRSSESSFTSRSAAAEYARDLLASCQVGDTVEIAVEPYREAAQR